MLKVTELELIGDRGHDALVTFKDGSTMRCRPDCLTENDDDGDLTWIHVYEKIFSSDKKGLGTIIDEEEIESIQELTD